MKKVNANTETIEVSETSTNQQEMNPKSTFAWVRKHKAPVLIIFLLILLAAVILFYQVRLSTVESEYIINKNEYEEKSLITYQNKVDSLNKDNAYRLSKVFSWSVRGELMRGNIEQVSLLTGQFIKTPGINKVSLIDPKSMEILIATDRKVEGEIFDKQKLLVNPKSVITSNQLVIEVMGLNDIIGFLFFEYSGLDNSFSKEPTAKLK